MQNISRRNLLERAAYAAATLAATPLLSRCAADASDTLPANSTAALGGGDMPAPLHIGMLLFPAFTMLDLVGPQLALSQLGTTHLISGSLDPVPCDTGIAIVPTTTYADCPRKLDILFVPGGPGTADAMRDPVAQQFLIERAPHARYITSVCTGSLVLAAAGLLNGYRAATHWASREALALFDVEVSEERVVFDRNRVTGGGVTAGIDFGLALVATLRDEQQAKIVQLMMEYAPEPPFDAGRPETAGPDVEAIVRNFTAAGTAAMIEAAKESLARMG